MAGKSALDEQVLSTADGLSEGQVRALAEDFRIRTRADFAKVPFARVYNQPLLREVAGILGFMGPDRDREQ